MTAIRALLAATRRLFLVVLGVAFLVGSATAVHATDSGADGAAATTTTLVASGAPVPGGGVPRVGPLDAGVGATQGHGVWWLFALGALQVVALVVMTRRSRARLGTRDIAP